MKNILPYGLIVSILISPLSADILKDSLNNMLHQKNSTGMVNLNGVGVGKKPKQRLKRVVRKSRPGSTVIGKYNDGKPVYKKEGDKYLKKATKGKIKDMDLLPKKQRLLVLKDLQKIYVMKHFKSRPGTAVIGTYNDGKPVHKEEADKYLKKATKGKIKDMDLLPKEQRLLVLKDLQKIYAMKHFESRPSSAVIATVNEHNITKKEADTFLVKVTAGKIKDFDRLNDKQRLKLVKDLAKPILIKNAAENNLTTEEKEAIFGKIWLERQRKLVSVTSDEMLTLYEAKKTSALAVNPSAKIPPYISMGERLKNEIKQNKVMSALVKDMNITIMDDTNASVTTIDSNKSLEKLDKIP